MKRPAQNFVVDTIAFIGFVFLTTTGVLMRYILPPGSGRFRVIWGLDRHGWGTVHFWIAIFFLSVLAIHLIFHWRWIATFITGKPREGSGLRVALGIVGLVGLLGLSVAPLLSPVEKTAGISDKGISLSEKHEDMQILGSMTLSEVEQGTGVPAELIIRELGIPQDTDKGERLGRLKMIYGFTIEDVRHIVKDFSSSSPKPPITN